MSRSAPKRPASARHIVASALAAAARQFPDITPQSLETESLSGADLGLAVAVHRCCLQRWLTLRHLLDRSLRQRFERLEPVIQGILLSAGAQIMFFDRIPDHAVVDESVNLVRRMGRPAAAGLVNAVLRKLGPLRGERQVGPWTASADRIPVDDGVIRLTRPCLPEPDNPVDHLSAATSHPRPLVRHWMERYGPDRTTQLCLYGIRTPPTIVWSGAEAMIWTKTQGELRAWLDAAGDRRVQDPAAGLAVDATRDLQPATIVDYCAGRGTKVRQLLAVHDRAQIVATDVKTALRDELAQSFAGDARVTVADPRSLTPGADLLLLDVPCTNTGVLARRPEARYRWHRDTVSRLVDLQRGIMDEAVPLVPPGGFILYCTCSLEPRENEQQARHLARRHGAEIVKEMLTFPAAVGEDHHDGGYYALLRRCGDG